MAVALKHFKNPLDDEICMEVGLPGDCVVLCMEKKFWIVFFPASSNASRAKSTFTKLQLDRVDEIKPGSLEQMQELVVEQRWLETRETVPTPSALPWFIQCQLLSCIIRCQFIWALHIQRCCNGFLSPMCHNSFSCAINFWFI